MAIKQSKEQRKKEIEFQTRMLQNLKKWMRMLILLSSVVMALAYWSLGIQKGKIFDIIGFVSIVIAVICLVLCGIVGLGLKRGEKNLAKIK